MARSVRTYRAFDRAFARLPTRIQKETLEKLQVLLTDASHPSLRVKRVRGMEGVWEMSVTMNCRITFELTDDAVILRRIGTHDMLRNP